MQIKMFNGDVDLTEEDCDILINLLDEASCSVDDGRDSTIMTDMTRLRMRGFDLIQAYGIMESTGNNPFGYAN
jgi:hypothetical protein